MPPQVADLRTKARYSPTNATTIPTISTTIWPVGINEDREHRRHETHDEQEIADLLLLEFHHNPPLAD